MLDESLENLGIPLGDRAAEPNTDDKEVAHDSGTCVSAAEPVNTIQPVVEVEVTGDVACGQDADRGVMPL